MSFDWLNDLPDFVTGSKASVRRALTAKHIADKPYNIIIIRNFGTSHAQPLDEQTVRIEGANTPQRHSLEVNSRTASVRGIYVFTLPDADIQVDDVFGWDGDNYKVISKTLHAGEKQYYAERFQ